MNRQSKLYLLSRLFFRDPVEFWDRLYNFIEGVYERLGLERSPNPAISLEALIAVFSENSNWDLNGSFQETAMQQIERHVHRLSSGSGRNGSFDPLHNADLTLARFCYAACRALSPNAVIETGVAHGVTTSFLLQALTQNQRGKLWSIDLPPLHPMADQSVGLFVPQQLRTIWQLQRGTARRYLPQLLAQLETIDMFIHDSLHTRSNMAWEFETVWPHLRPGGMLIADDVQDHSVFLDFVAKAQPHFSAIVAEESKVAAFGVAVKAP